MRVIITGLAILAMTGCSNNENVVYQPEKVERQYSNQNEPLRVSTVELVSAAQRGAAIGAAGYVHVVATERATSKLDDKPSIGSVEDVVKNLALASAEEATVDPAKSIEKVAKKSYSIYEMSRWERFCGHGKMDERDWAFIADQGRENLPETLQDECSEPGYTRQEYIQAWDAKCLGEDTEEFQVIRSRTISPKVTCKSS